MVVCKFFLRGHCKNGGLQDGCRFEHPSNNNNGPTTTINNRNPFPTNNRNPFAPLQDNPRTTVASGSNRVPVAGRDNRDFRENRGNPYKLDKLVIGNDLSGKERPQWILSAYGPGMGAPLQLFGGMRELSFEELRMRHYQLAAQGNQQEAINEAQALVNNAEQQIQAALGDIDGAIKYIINGENEHPNRIDICNTKVLPPASAQPPAPSSFSTISAPVIPQPQVPTSTFGQSPAFGQPAALGRPTTSFGQPSLTFGQSSAPAQVFGQPNTFQQAKPTVQPSTTSQPSPFGQSLAPPQANPFGQPSGPSQTGGFGRPTKPSPFAQSTNASRVSQLPAASSSTFGAPAATATTGAFGQPSNAARQPFVQNNNTAASTNGPAGNTQAASNIPWDSDKRITNWKGKPVSYQDGVPCYKGNDGNWVRIWFPHGAPIFTKTPEMPENAYNPATKDEYAFAKQHGSFKNGTMPEVPPRREWCDWDF